MTETTSATPETKIEPTTTEPNATPANTTTTTTEGSTQSTTSITATASASAPESAPATTTTSSPASTTDATFTPPVKQWKTTSELALVSKNKIAGFIKQWATDEFLVTKGLDGSITSIVKNVPETKLKAAYFDLFTSQAWRKPGSAPATKPATTKPAAKTVEPQHAATPTTATTKPTTAAKSTAAATPAAKTAAAAPAEKKLFTKSVTKRGDSKNVANKGDMISMRYTGSFVDGKIFDSNSGKNDKPLKFKLGSGRVIRGWDEGIIGMCVGEKARLEIEPAWAYGKKGVPDAKIPIPPNTKLVFEIELVAID
ncbi:peptidyl-prolyl cis-trans isomerase FKBP3 [Pelomyxa schiedti]|nr:peptidyl-prolyl cis-trans isomerase FKBP3 [Pelomyxa schiedti]KAH3744674.1 peptidyl-prolyl cis-trans isomerase FKBP3 [Pelomyxa schiedti]